jgi:hypothetical protein
MKSWSDRLREGRPHQAGAKPADLTPVWRVLDEASPTLGKLPVAARSFFRKRRSSEAQKIRA